MAIWKRGTVDQREAMVLLFLSGRYTASEVAARFEVSRPTLYAWVARYQAEGRAGLVDRAPIAHSCPHRTPAWQEAKIVALRRTHGWCGRKLRQLLHRQRPRVTWPAASTIDAIVARHGLVTPRRRRPPAGAPPFRRTYEPTGPGELLTADFKGQFRLGNGEVCYPLTLLDWQSRYLVACQALSTTAFVRAWPVFERVFREYGLPLAVQSDNGPPFACTQALGGISQLSVQLMTLDVQPVFITPGQPQQNGVHERMHRTLGQATRPPSATTRAQQIRFDAFRQEYNAVRPHDALALAVPAAHFTGFRRPYPRRPPRVDYPADWEVRVVATGGTIKFRGHRAFVAGALVGERIALQPIEDGVWTVHFGRFALGRFDERDGTCV
jgi:transposase InsO family protein